MREATLHLSEQDIRRLGLTDLLEAAREASLQRLTELLTEGRGSLYHVQLAESIPETVLNTATYLEWWERLSEPTDRVSYLWKVHHPIDKTPSPQDRTCRRQEDQAQSPSAVELCIIGAQDALDLSTAVGPDEEINPHLERITDYHGPSTPLELLTDRQLEVLEEAYQSGYFEVPRQASTTDVASRLSLDPSTVAEHLQRAERNLVRALLTHIDRE